MSAHVAAVMPPLTLSLTDDDYARLHSAIANDAVIHARTLLAQSTAQLTAAFDHGVAIDVLIHARSQFMDALLTALWQRFMPAAPAALVAVGGYGRAELLPSADIDVLILIAPGQLEALAESISALVTFLWDLNIDIGHAVRTPADCQHHAQEDVTILTNLIEARLITGTAILLQQMRQAVAPTALWSSDLFFAAKCREQLSRWHKYGDTAYNLEPNIKENPGGLRDIQMIGWVTKRHFEARGLADLVQLGFLTASEYDTLSAGQQLLWRIRFALHRLAGRREDRLLFDYQRTLAAQFGFADGPNNLAVEQFMQQYYRTVIELNRLNEMLLQLFQEAILLHADLGTPQLLNPRFQIRSGYLEVRHPRIFAQFPFALLEIFHLLQLHPELIGVRASTIRLIREHRHRIDDEFREDLRVRSLFMEIMRYPSGLTHVLTRMNRYGVLACYIPAFANIVGRMQYDLFHVYTVDEHTLRLIRNLRRFSVTDHDHEFPLCSAIAHRIPKRELLYLAGLLHDVAKGRGGDHSLLGARDAWEFCQLHYLSDYDSHLVMWLIEKHLLMSLTAQRKDIRDTSVIQEFAALVGDVTHLDYLYLLTVADARATNPKRWNSWNDALLRELYLNTRQALERGLDNPQAQDQLIEQKQTEAMRILAHQAIEAEQCRTLWRLFNAEFFLAGAPEDIAWQTQQVLRAQQQALLPLIAIRALPERGCSEIFIYTHDNGNLFMCITALLDRRHLNIMDARITTADEMAINSFQILTADGEPIAAGHDSEELCAALYHELRNLNTGCIEVARRLPRAHRYFSIATRVSFNTDQAKQRTIMRLVTLDRPGLLAQLGAVFACCDICVQGAKITTIGAEVDDVFFITTQQAKPIESAVVLDCLQQAIQQRLEQTTPP